MREFSLDEGATEMLLIRHGETLAETGRTTSDDPPLDGRGRRQAHALAQRLARARIATVYSSPMQSAAETAKAIATIADRAIAYDERLREAAPSESQAEIRARMIAALETVAAEHPGVRVAVVGHAHAINAYLAAMLGTPASEPFPIRPAAIAIVQSHGGRSRVVAVNDTAHLEPHRSKSTRLG